MPVKLRPHSLSAPLSVAEEKFEKLAHKNDRGWSVCADQEELLAKLCYLRAGRADGKLDEAQFLEREARLVVTWLKGLI